MYVHEEECVLHTLVCVCAELHTCLYVYHASPIACNKSATVSLCVLFSPRVYNLLLLYDKCAVLRCMCGLKMKRSAAPCRRKVHNVFRHIITGMDLSIVFLRVCCFLFVVLFPLN